MILSKPDLLKRLPKIIPLAGQMDPSLVNPASIDIRLGESLIYEVRQGMTAPWDLKQEDYILTPNEFVLVSTYEYITVPNDLAINLFLKSSVARRGIDHSLAFWIDPGWKGILTMEVKNNLRFNDIHLAYMQPFAQLVVHQLSSPVENEDAYSGRYQGAQRVESSKEEWERVAK